MLFAFEYWVPHVVPDTVPDPPFALYVMPGVRLYTARYVGIAAVADGVTVVVVEPVWATVAVDAVVSVRQPNGAHP